MRVNDSLEMDSRVSASNVLVGGFPKVVGGLGVLPQKKKNPIFHEMSAKYEKYFL